MPRASGEEGEPHAPAQGPGGITEPMVAPPTRTDRTAPDGKITLAQFLLVASQLLLLLLVVRQFAIENKAFLRLLLLASGGFVVHAFLPFRYRLPFFVALSLAGIGAVLGPEAGTWLVGIGLLLIGACHLPISMPARVALLLTLGAGLATLRAEWLDAPWPQTVWPILGSMFMFRLIVYLYDLAHEKAPPSAWRTLAYFFLLPNVCFPLFPIVDYKTFRRGYYDEQAYCIYQIGVDWILRGVVQLILYRVVYYYFTMAPSEVMSGGDLAQYVVSTYLLYLRMSGQFHIIVGILRLFGFSLPETNHHYLLASSFTDFWRRINIYWKDFMLKIFYYPAYFKLRASGPTRALVLSTLFVFACTWLLHSYQWFWLRGAFPITGPDAVFWTALALLVVANSLYETHYGRQRTLGSQPWSVRRAAASVLRTVATFLTMCLLWSLWTAESLSAWVSLWSGLGGMGSGRSWLLPGLVLGGIVAGALWKEISREWKGFGRPYLAAGHSPVRALALLVFLVAIGRFQVYSRLGPETATVIHSLKTRSLSRVDAALMQRGYYEDLLRVDRFNSELWEVYMNKPSRWLDAIEQRGLGQLAEKGVCPCRTGRTGLERFVDGFLQKELTPSSASTMSFGTISTNRWGMRDQDYEKQPALGTYRIALLGSSTTMGWGVKDGDTYETLVERRLNEEHAGKPHARYEILNFAVAGYEPLQQLPVLDKALTFRPDAVFYMAMVRELDRAAEYLSLAVRYRFEVPYQGLHDVIRRAGVDSEMDETAAGRRLRPFREEILRWLYREIVERCRLQGVLPVWMLLAELEKGTWEREVDGLARLAAEAGFRVLELKDVFAGRNMAALRLAEWDNHPNAEGHRLIADGLYEVLTRQRDVVFSPGGSGRAHRGADQGRILGHDVDG